MTPEPQKADLVCAFHGDLEGYMARIERKVDRIEKSVGELGLWRAKVVGYSMGAGAIASLLIKLVVK
jgi:hypothetical protein